MLFNLTQSNVISTDSGVQMELFFPWIECDDEAILAQAIRSDPNTDLQVVKVDLGA